MTEATFISAKAGGRLVPPTMSGKRLFLTSLWFVTGYKTVPGIFTPAQVAGWKKVVDAVHAQGSFAFLQLWALGRAAHEADLKLDNPEFEVVSASDLAFEGGETPRPLTEAEIDEYVQDYAAAAKAFVEGAGGDGVES